MGFLDLFLEPADARARREERQARQRESLARLAAGSIPLEAAERLQASRELPWTSGLDVAEVLLVRQAGFEALGQVMGSSVYHAGVQWQQRGASFEMEVLSRAHAHARRLALSRLAEEAALLGATAVVGVQLRREKAGAGRNLIEFSATGTAIREEDTRAAPSTLPAPVPLPPRFRDAIGAPKGPPEVLPPRDVPATPRPALSALSGADFWKLRAAGFRAVGIAAGNCVYSTFPDQATREVLAGGLLGSNTWRNAEVKQFTEALYEARERALERLESEAFALGAAGVIGVEAGVEVEPRHHEHPEMGQMMFHFHALGTAIVPLPAPVAPPRTSVELSISLFDKPGGR